MKETLLNVKHLTLGVTERDGSVNKAVDDISFEVRKGEILGIVGESGCGKSLTVMTLMGLMKDDVFVMDGQILFGQDDLVRVTPERRRQINGNDLSIIYQEPMTSLNPLIKIGRQVGEPLRLHRKDLSEKEIDRMVLELLTEVGIQNPGQIMKSYPHQLSGGMRQRVMIAMASICRPRILVADEPTTALDVTISAQIFDLMNRLKAEHGTAIMMITHNMGVVAEMADEVAVMYMGNIVEYGRVEDVFANPTHPYTKALLASIPVLGKGRNQKLEPIRGVTPDPFNRPKGCQFCPRCDYAGERCETEMPDEEWVTEGHYTRCFNYRKVMADGK